MQIRDNYKYTYITEATTTQVLIGQGALVSIIFNAASGGNVKVIDGISGSTANIATIAANNTATKEYRVQVVNGIRIITASTCDITVVSSGLPS